MNSLNTLELHPVGILRRPESPHGAQITEQQLPLGVFTDNLVDRLIDHLLVSLTLLARLVRLLLGGEDLTLLLLRALLALTTEVLIVDVLRQLHAGDVQLGGGTNNVTLADATQRAAVHFEGSSDQQQARVELFQEDNTFTLVWTGENNENCAGGKGIADCALVSLEQTLSWALLNPKML